MAERTFYHLTAAKNLASILEVGLRPRRGPRSRNYGQGESRQAIYFFLEMWDALHLLGDMYGYMFDEELALLGVQLEEGAFVIEKSENQAVAMEMVAPERISVVARGLWGESRLQDQHDLAQTAHLSRLQYHVTPARNLKRIAREGLRVRTGQRSRKLGEQKSIFLFPTKQAAQDATANWLGDEFAEGTRLALLKVLVPEATEISFDPAVGYESQIANDVPAANVYVLSDNF